jgi:hypothetical protein
MLAGQFALQATVLFHHTDRPAGLLERKAPSFESRKLYPAALEEFIQFIAGKSVGLCDDSSLLSMLRAQSMSLAA